MLFPTFGRPITAMTGRPRCSRTSVRLGPSTRVSVLLAEEAISEARGAAFGANADAVASTARTWVSSIA